MDSWIRIAHRGASGIAPENTCAAFKKATEIGVDAVELDLHGTIDDEIVAIHDPTLDRTTNISGYTNQTTLNTIKQADAGTWFNPQYAGETVPTLEEALDCIAGTTIAVLEIKDAKITESVVQKITEMNLLEMVVIISFQSEVIKTIRAMETRIPTGWLIGSGNGNTNPVHLCQQLSSMGSNLLNVNHILITPEFAYEVRRRGISLWSWTVDDVERMRELLKYGVQGITSNHPEYFIRV